MSVSLSRVLTNFVCCRCNVTRMVTTPSHCRSLGCTVHIDIQSMLPMSVGMLALATRTMLSYRRCHRDRCPRCRTDGISTESNSTPDLRHYHQQATAAAQESRTATLAPWVHYY